MEPESRRSPRGESRRARAARAQAAGPIQREPNSCDPSTVTTTDASLAELYQSFAAATGWRLHLRPRQVTAGGADPFDRDSVRSADLDFEIHLARAKHNEQPTSSRSAALQLATAIAGHVALLGRTRRALRASEAELAAGVPVYVAAAQADQLADRLEVILRCGARTVGCHAAGAYLLDEATSCLKLRASWGLPAERLADPPRRLATQLADLEALLGHAVVLDDSQLQSSWPVPEPCGAAVCLPLATEASLLGTAWFFAPQSRLFDDRETEILELAAGRLAVELELAMLRSAVQSSRA
ncbi:MAG: GAF domain-containing protein [Pirellulales bacterium]